MHAMSTNHQVDLIKCHINTVIFIIQDLSKLKKYTIDILQINKLEFKV